MQNSPLIKIIITIVIALLIPIFTYTAFQFSQSNANEELIKNIYERSLDSILLSVNQHCYEEFVRWASGLSSIITSNRRFTDSEWTLNSNLRNFVRKEPVIFGAFFRFSEGSIPFYFSTESNYYQSETERFKFKNQVNQIINQHDKKFQRNIRRVTEDNYTKPEAFPFETNEEDNYTILIFPILQTNVISPKTILAGVLVKNMVYVDEIVAREFSSQNDGDFLFGVTENESGKLLFSTDEEETEFEQSKELWLLPNMSIQIKLAGATLQQISKSRNRTNLFFLLFVNIVLLIGVYYLVRNLSHEMTLVKMKTNFVANVSHELRTPLALIRMFAETLEMGRVPNEEKKQHYYKTIMSESSRLTGLINNILDFSKIESNKKEYSLVPDNLANLVRQTLDMYEFRLEQNNFKLAINIAANLPDVEIDHEAITQAFVNLLDNAVKYSGEKKEIEIKLEKTNSRVILSVKDKGIGIPDSEQTKIFEKFYRVGNSLVHNTKGSGLGLSLVKHIMDVHNGEITVKSKVNEGSAFSLHFPIIEKKE